MVIAVVDASVAAKWILPEPGTEQALQWMQDATQLIGPEIIHIEVAGAVLRRFREGTLSRDQASAAFKAWDRIIDGSFVRLVPTRESYAAALELALELRHPLADCLYLAVARSCNAELLTADRVLRDRGQGASISIRFLS